MNGVVVTVPMRLWADWIREGNLPGQPWDGMESHFFLRGNHPRMQGGDRVYVVAHGKLRGYAPIHRIDLGQDRRFALVRRGGAVAVTIDAPIRGFRGWRWHWWDEKDERPFPEWAVP